MRDNLFNKKIDLVDWSFDESISKVFDDMVIRSIPGYRNTLELIGIIAKKYGINNTNFYDLGCSTGATSLALSNNKNPSIKIIALDNSKEMIKQVQNNLSNIKNVEIICDDLQNIKIKNASIVVLNWTLQFINPNNRKKVINKIYNGLNKGGVLVLSEKLKFNKEDLEQNLDNLHLEFKKSNGYSELEIANKRQMLENVLIRDNKETHFTRLKDSGFKNYFIASRVLNFATFVAIK